MSKLEDDMLAEVNRLIGDGWAPEYYDQAAAPFVDIANRYAQKLQDDLDECEKKRRRFSGDKFKY